MRKFIILGGLLISLLFASVTLSAPTSTIVSNLFIDAIKGTGNPCLIISSTGLISTSTCGTSVATTTINNLQSASFTFASSNGISVTSSSPSTITWGFNPILTIGGTATTTISGNSSTDTVFGGLVEASSGFITYGIWPDVGLNLGEAGAFIGAAATGILTNTGLRVGGALNATGTITQNGTAVLTTSTNLGVANFTTSSVSQWLVNNHSLFGGGLATTTACGTLPSNTGTDNAGTITVGTGVVTSCTLVFNTAFTTNPSCTMTVNTSAITGGITSMGTTSTVFSFSATIAGGLIYYHCI